MEEETCHRYTHRQRALFLADEKRFNPPLSSMNHWKNAQQYASALANFIAKFKWVFGIFMPTRPPFFFFPNELNLPNLEVEPGNVYFFANEHWENMPLEWRAPLLSLTDDELKACPPNVTHQPFTFFHKKTFLQNEHPSLMNALLCCSSCCMTQHYIIFHLSGSSLCNNPTNERETASIADRTA